MNKFFKNRNGQVMFLTVVVLGSVIASVTVVAGVLMSFQIRRSADVAASTRAVFAADAGTECMLFEIFNQGSSGTVARDTCNSKSTLGNDSEYVVENSPGDVIPGIPNYFTSIGSFSNSRRSVQINLKLSN